MPTGGRGIFAFEYLLMPGRTHFPECASHAHARIRSSSKCASSQRVPHAPTRLGSFDSAIAHAKLKRACLANMTRQVAIPTLPTGLASPNAVGGQTSLQPTPGVLTCLTVPCGPLSCCWACWVESRTSNAHPRRARNETDIASPSLNTSARSSRLAGLRQPGRCWGSRQPGTRVRRIRRQAPRHDYTPSTQERSGRPGSLRTTATA